MPELTSPHPIGEHAPQQSDLPAPPRAHALTLENRARLTVTGVTRIVRNWAQRCKLRWGI